MSPGRGRALVVRRLGLRDYAETWRRMREFTDRRGADTRSEVWIVEHPPVFTLGQAGRAEHLLDPGEIPVVQSDRGGQVTYHGPGQLVLYLLLSLREAGVGVRGLVDAMEQSVIATLAAHGVHAIARGEAPGVYVDGRKIASLGLRVRRGCCYHGLALNVTNDLAPFRRIEPCGQRGLEVTSTSRLGVEVTPASLADELVSRLASALGYRVADA